MPSIFTDGLPCFQVQHNLPLAQGLFPVALTAAMLSNKVIQVAISINDGTILIGNLPAHNEGFVPIGLLQAV